MNIIYAEERATAAEVRAKMDDPPSYSAVRALLRVLEEKGHLKHEYDGPRYMYSPTVSRKEASKSALAKPGVNLLRRLAGPGRRGSVGHGIRQTQPGGAGTVSRTDRGCAEAGAMTDMVLGMRDWLLNAPPITLTLLKISLVLATGLVVATFVSKRSPRCGLHHNELVTAGCSRDSGARNGAAGAGRDRERNDAAHPDARTTSGDWKRSGRCIRRSAGRTETPIVCAGPRGRPSERASRTDIGCNSDRLEKAEPYANGVWDMAPRSSAVCYALARRRNAHSADHPEWPRSNHWKVG